MRKNKYIIEKPFGNISSFNFSRNAFFSNVWDDMICKARGLYVDTKTYEVVARSYNKFFNVGERTETHLESLKCNLKFPVTAYVKENGFLGIVGKNPETNDLLITSKSSISGDYSEYLRNLLYKIYGQKTMDSIKNCVFENNVSFVFECCDIVNDRHIIEYPESKVVLLDIIYNDLTFRKLPYDELVDVANKLNLVVKEKAFTLNNWSEFIDWYNYVNQNNFVYNGENIEGFVVEDASGFMTKIKCSYYKFWKKLRGVAVSVLKTGSYKYMGSLTSPIENEFYGFCKRLYVSPKRAEILENMNINDICSLRRKFFKECVNKVFDETKEKK